MTEEEIRSQARLMAIERLACHTHNMALRILQRLSGLTADEINEIERQSLEEMRLVPVAGAPAALSDVLADETFQELSRLIEYARSLRDKAHG